jgi:steroid delta-isomerase-like uncharacterized protein
MRLTGLVIVAALLVACAPCPEEQLEANKLLVKRFIDVVNAADWEALNDLLAEDFKRHCDATPDVQVNSREEFRQLQEMFYAIMPDQHIEAEMLIAEGDKVAGYATYSGTQTGPMGEFPASGKYAESKFITIFRIEDGRVAELWVEFDNLAMLTQLGHWPPPGAQSDKNLDSREEHSPE